MLGDLNLCRTEKGKMPGTVPRGIWTGRGFWDGQVASGIQKEYRQELGHSAQSLGILQIGKRDQTMEKTM